MEAWLIVQALWLFLPAYVANMSPVFSAKLFPWWPHPIDGGRSRDDGTRILGDGKTWRGLVGGAVTGGLAALAMAAIAPHWILVEGWDFGTHPAAGPCDGGCGAGTTPTWAVFAFGAVVGFMALVGDVAESYVKRRTGRPRGAPWFPFDQLDFVVFGLIGMVLGAPLLIDGWVQEALLGHWLVLTTILVGTPGLHILVNRIGYWLKLKDVPH